MDHLASCHQKSNIMYKNFGSEKSKCTHEGCSKHLKGEHLQKHEINCGYRKISCPLSAFKICSEEIRMKDTKNHLREHKTVPQWGREKMSVSWVKTEGSSHDKNTKAYKKNFGCSIQVLSDQNFFLFIENGKLKKDDVFKIYAFLIDSPKKAKNLSLQTKAKKDESATLYLNRSGLVNAIDEQNPEPCFTMTYKEKESFGEDAKKTFFEFTLLDQTPKTSVMQFAYKNCKKIFQKLK